MPFSAAPAPIVLGVRALQWISSVINLGFFSFFVHKSVSTDVVYNLIISVLSVVFFLPAFLSPFRSVLSKFVVAIDLVFSYLWLTAFIFSAQSYDENTANFSWPLGVNISIKHAAIAFTWFAFFFTLVAGLLEVLPHWTDAASDSVVREKPTSANPPVDAPADTTV